MSIVKKILKNTILLLPAAGLLGLWSGAFKPLEVMAENHITHDKLTVVELYTSQSCSSCPPADKVLNELADNENIITLGCHVTYWDHLHWKDTLSQPICTDRQRASAAYRRSRRVFTPEVHINGEDSIVGSRKLGVLAGLDRAIPLDRITIETESDTSATVKLPTVSIGGSYTLWLVGTLDEHTQKIPSGENRGRTVTYKNSVLSHEGIGSWNGQAREISIDIPQEIRGDFQPDEWVVLAQQNGFGPIVAAGKYRP